MDIKIIFIKTAKGGDEFKNKTSFLSGDYKRVLGLVDDKSTVEELIKRAAPSLRGSFNDMLQKLANDGFIQDGGDGTKDKESHEAKVNPSQVKPSKLMLKMAIPAVRSEREDLDFTSIMAAPDSGALAANEAKAKAQEAEQEKIRHIKFEAEAKARAEAETARLKAEQEAAKAKAEPVATQARMKQEAEAKARTEAETARLKAEQEVAKAKAELAATQARMKQEAEAKARTEVETARLNAEQEVAKAKAELAATQARMKQEAEAKARAEAETARLKAEQEVAKAKAELAATQARMKQEAEAKARTEAETARLKAEQEVAKAKAELAATQARIKQEAEAKARAEVETARLKAEQEAAKAKAELAATQARIKQEAEIARLKAEQEAVRAKAELVEMQATTKAAHLAGSEPHTLLPEDKVAQARADDEARQLAESQSSIWVEAEQRAKVQAQQADEMQHKAQKVEKITPAPVITRARKKPRQPFPLGKIIVCVLGLFVVLSLLLPFVWPMQEYISKFEQNLSAQLHQPVHIGHMRAQLLPLPKLELQAVSVGSGEELRAASVVLNFSVIDLFADTKVINRVEIAELMLKAESFSKTLSWIQAVGGNKNYPVVQIAVHRARISGTDLNLPAVSGEINFDGQGSLIKAVMGSEDRKLSMELQPQQSRWQLAINIKESNWPLIPGILFDELNLKGEVSPSEARFSVIEGKFYKGKLLGNGWLTWANGWQMSGQIAVTAVSLQAALPQSVLNGDLDAKASFTQRGAKLAMLAQTPRLDGNFSVKKGFINGIDMVETARLARRQGTSAGRTHFDELSGTLLIDGSSIQIHQIKISAGILSGNGFVDVASGKQLSGRINVGLKIRTDMGSTPLLISGTLSEPTWRTGR